MGRGRRKSEVNHILRTGLGSSYRRFPPPKDMIHFLSSLASFQPSRTVPSVSRHPPYGRLKGVDEGNDRSRAERETDGGLDSLSFISLDPPNGT